MTYHRFVMREGKSHPTNIGAVNRGTQLWTSFTFGSADDDDLGKIIKWFNHYLLVPKKIPVDKGLFWFKDDPRFVAKGKELQEFLMKHGYAVSHFQSEDPGEILVEDKYQVIARFNRRVKYWEE